MSGRGSVYRRGSSWVAHVKWQDSSRPTGWAQRKVTRSTKPAAEIALTEMLRQVDLGIAVPVDMLTVAQYHHGWLDHLEHVVGRKQTTVASYRAKLRQYVLPVIGDMRIQRVSVVDIDRIYRRMTQSAATKRHVYRLLRKSFGDAERQGVIPINVVVRSSPPSSSAAKAPTFPTWTWDELATFLDHIVGRAHSEALTFAALTGARRAEVCGLRWGDLDLDGRTTTIAQTVNDIDSALVISDTKNHRSRPVGLDDHLIAMLRRWRATQAAWRLQVGRYWFDRDAVFPGPDGDWLKPATLTQQFDRLVAELDVPRIRFHDLRHTHGTLLVQQGRDAKLVSERLGHSTVAFTLDRYVHPTTEQQIDAANDFTRRLGRS